MFTKDSTAALVSTAYQFDVNIDTPDGTNIVATVFVPRVPKGVAIPLLLHSHGFGGSRVKSLNFDEKTQTSEENQDVMVMAYNQAPTVTQTGMAGSTAPLVPVFSRQGWYVISYDQRGHGDSGGKVAIMDPKKEGEDYKAVLNWAEQNLPHLAYRLKNGVPDPVIGAVGRSYGGAYQLMGMGVDNRVDAILPGGTWYDLRYSLNPGGVPKSAYLDGLVASGAQSNRGRYEDYILSGLVDTNTSGTVNATTVATLGAHGTVAYCDGGRTASIDGFMTQKSVPAFFIQGARDVLFNLNESVQNYECYFRANPNAKMLFAKYGHSLDGLMLQATPTVPGGKYAFHESRIWLNIPKSSCGGDVYDDATNRCIINLKDMMFQFLVEHLIGFNESILPAYLGKSPSALPTMTAVLENGAADPTAIVMPVLPSAGRVKIPAQDGLSNVQGPVTVTLGLAGAPAGLNTTPLAQLGSMTSLPISTSVPGKCYVGAPKALIEMTSASMVPVPDPIMFAGLAVRKGTGVGSTLTLLHEQVTPLRGYGTKFIELPGISVKLAADESLEMVFAGYSPFFLANFSRAPNALNVRGAVALPQTTVTSGTGSPCL
ncbi:MAG: CocE/NonD family hydrolase [Burkholderiales bacterium]|jgi:pimeloyl-ACP methyl ester carboxylesterase|nr:CocE/NonD family hydrolase [Burkholderiales bacterium]